MKNILIKNLSGKKIGIMIEPMGDIIDVPALGELNIESKSIIKIETLQMDIRENFASLWIDEELVVKMENDKYTFY